MHYAYTHILSHMSIIVFIIIIITYTTCDSKINLIYRCTTYVYQVEQLLMFINLQF